MKLRLLGPDNEEREVALESASVTVGRASDNDLVLADRTVSRRQCVLHVEEDGTLRVEDAGSRYGTFVDGEQVKDEAVLHPGATLYLGAWRAELADGAHVDASQRATVNMQAARPETRATRKTRLIKDARGTRRSPAYVLLLLALAATAGLMLALVLLDLFP